MPIIESQIKKLINDASINSLKKGRVLDLSFISKLIESKIRLLSGGPIFKLRPQYDRELFNCKAYNLSIEDIKFDLEVLYNEIISRTSDLIASFNSIDISYKTQKNQLNLIRSTVDDLLFSTKNADDYFYGVYDNFSSLDKVNINKTTDGAIDLAEGVAQLPFNAPSTIRVPLTHLTSLAVGDVKYTALENTPISGRNGAGTIFGYAFTDISSIWRYEITTSSKNGVQLWFTFPLSSELDIVRITRVEFNGISGNDIKLTLLTSLDSNENFTKPPGTKNRIFSKDTRKITWDFADIPVRYIRILIDKASPDFVSNNQAINIANPILGQTTTNAISNPFSKMDNKTLWVYNFSVSNIGVYKIGRTFNSVIESKPLIPDSKIPEAINQISLQVDEDIQQDSTIDYYIALCDSAGSIKRDFIQINPSNRIDTNIPKQLSFGESVKDHYDFTGNYLNIPNYVIANKIQFYPIYNLDRDKTYKFASNFLYRGGNLFSRNQNKRDTTRVISDNYIDFSDGNRTKQLYSIFTEVAQVITRNISQGNILKSFLKVSGPIVNSPRIVRQSIDPDVSVDPEPDYAIAKVEHIRPVMTITRVPIKPTGNPVTINGIQIPIASTWLASINNSSSIGVPILLNGQPVDIIVTGNNTPVLRYIGTNGFQYIFRDGIDYSIKRSDDIYFQNFPGWNTLPLHWRIVPIEPTPIIVQSGSPLVAQFGNTGTFYITGGNLPPVTLGSITLVSDQELFLDFTIDPDITERVQSVSYDSNELELNSTLELGPGDSVLVTYRFVPSNIVRGSLRVTQSPGTTAPGIIYQDGRDYTINIDNGTITKLAGGTISNIGNDIVYVDFSYREELEETETFSVWAYYSNKEPYKFVYNELSLRTNLGESFTWSFVDGGNNNVKDLATQSSFVLTKGWHFFTVKSLNPDKFSDAAINKVLKLRSVDGYQLFQRKDWGGTFFDILTAYRAPLSQVTFQTFKNAVLKTDHTKFAIDDSKIYINFKPGNTEELYSYRVDSNGIMVYQDYEEFMFDGIRKHVSDKQGLDTNPGYIIFKAVLSRGENSNGGITPKLSGYNIRVRY